MEKNNQWKAGLVSLLCFMLICFHHLHLSKSTCKVSEPVKRTEGPKDHMPPVHQ